MFNLTNIFSGKSKFNKDAAAAFLKTSPEALAAFEEAYGAQCLNKVSDNFFEVNAKQAAEEHTGIDTSEDITNYGPIVDDLISRIVTELINKTAVWEYDGHKVTTTDALQAPIDHPVTNEEIKQLPEHLRPQLTGNLMKVDITEPSYVSLAWFYQKYLETRNQKTKRMMYHHFRQGLDILDLDAISYAMIDTNRNSMSHWLPQMTEAVMQQDFFKIPKTTIIKVPLTLLQLTRQEYAAMTRTTLDIVDKFCQKVFHLDETKDYFIKTGTYSSKFDFRNAHVTGAKEVRELGEYLLFIHFQALQMAGPLTQPCMYGVSTTTEWVVREFIHDTENNPCIYKGLPLHTEYRAFVDFDTKEILGINPYWDPTVMKNRFGHANDADSPHNMHDYIIYTNHEETLMNRYHANKDNVLDQLQNLVNNVHGLSGQWSVDIMQNGNDFWLIDMALAANSALKECIPAGKLKPVIENWMPQLPD